MSVSILVLTLNEEINLPECLDSVSWCDDIVVLDSFSTDATTDIAKRRGARVVQRGFDNWASHQNWAMEEIAFRHPWVFYLDADERMTPELRDEIHGIASNDEQQEVAFYCGRRNHFMGRWIKHAMPPGAVMRFFRPAHIRFERLVNPVPVINGRHGYLRGYLDHFNFSKGISEWFNKHNKYSSLEAIEGIAAMDSRSGVEATLWSGDPATRRRALKNLSIRLPFRPLIKFAYMYLLNRGFLDGYPGFAYCVLQAMYEYMIVLKMREIQRRTAGLPV